VRSAFARRLFLLTAFEIGTVLCAIVLGAALLSFGAYVGTLRSALEATQDRVVGSIVDAGAIRDARSAAAVAVSRYPRSEVVVLLSDADLRIDVYQTGARLAQPHVDIRPHGDVGGEPRASGPVGHLVLGLATAFGLSVERAHVGRVDIFVKANEASLVGVVTSYLPALGLALVIAVGIGILLARILTRQVVRPLEDVQRALERFATGDLTPQPVETGGNSRLQALAVAYNGAIDQMERAFAERDRANAAMRQFIADAGHQLRTPLTVIRGFIAILRKGELRTPEDREHILETMNRQSVLMGALIQKLMLLDTWEKVDSVAVAEPIDVAQLVDDVVAPIAEANPARRVDVDVDGTTALAAIDPSDLSYAVTNLVDNAIKYTHGAVRVRVTAGEKTVSIVVADDGPGMTADEAAHAFDRFFRGNRRDVDGSGLGLPIAKRAVERARGTLALASDPTAGTTFTITLARFDRRAAERKPALV
jgi:signal transduction histidine kinase